MNRILIEKEYPKIRSRQRKILDGKTEKDNLILCPEKKLCVEVYNLILNDTISSVVI